MSILTLSERHGVKVGLGPRNPGPRNPGTQNPGRASKFKCGTWDPLRLKNGTAGPLFKV